MRYDPIRLEIFKHLFHSVAEEVGAALRRSAFSPNIKERRDYSGAVFDPVGQVLAMGDHMPVHLGSMPMSVVAAISALRLERGDIAVLNDPYAGGTHLPDLTMVMPVFASRDVVPAFYVANRAHHADMGGAFAGSVGLSREIYQEGLRIPPVKLVERGRIVRDVMSLVLSNVRTPHEREGDLKAQISACRTGERRLIEYLQKYGKCELAVYSGHLLDYSEEMMRAALKEIPAGTCYAEDFLDDDGVTSHPLKIAVTVRLGRSTAEVDFTGTDPQCAGSVNAVDAITDSAVFYVFRCLLGEQVPATAGLMRPIRVIAPAGTVVNARPPSAVAGGNVETSQRIVDTLLLALSGVVPSRIPAASQGTMNNLSVGGMDSRRGSAVSFAYYETICGGAGAGPLGDGLSGVHTHMTNSLNTPVEALEHAYPMRVRKYRLRRGSGGRGVHGGGDGVVRELEVLTNVQFTVLSDRRSRPPYGLQGGSPGATGRNTIIVQGRRRKLGSKAVIYAATGTVFRIETPGGGGWGRV